MRNHITAARTLLCPKPTYLAGHRCTFNERRYLVARHHQQTVFLFGGDYSGEPQDFINLWFFDVMYNTWNKPSSSDDSQSRVSWPAFGAGTVSDLGVAYYYGVYLSNQSDPKWAGDPFMLNSLTLFDMNTLTWSNHTYKKTHRAEGTLHYLPASAHGMLVYLGGVETRNGNRTFVSQNTCDSTIPKLLPSRRQT